MDRIETVEESNARENPPAQQPAEPSSSRPPLATLRAPGSTNRVRRPSIRLSRLPSTSSLETVNKEKEKSNNQPPPIQTDQSQAGPSLSRQISIRSPVAEEDESWHAGRRRSSSEPRPGRWSSPPPDVLSRVGTPMMALPENASHRGSWSQNPASPAPQAEGEGPENEQQGTENLEPPAPALQRPAGRLRRTSQAAMNRFSRNRASTVTGAPPTLGNQKAKEEEEQRANEYKPHMVDVLDVIGKSSPVTSAKSEHTNRTMLRPRGCRALHSHQCSELLVRAQSGWLGEPYAHVYPHTSSIR